MTRDFKDADIDTVMSIWLSANIEAHAFIKPEFWINNYDVVKVMIPQAEIYVSENNQKIDGFIGLEGNYIAGIFVEKSARRKGIGSGLLSIAKKNKEKLILAVYRKNTMAVNFYLSRGFKIDKENTDLQTQETEYIMIWEKSFDQDFSHGSCNYCAQEEYGI